MNPLNKMKKIALIMMTLTMLLTCVASQAMARKPAKRPTIQLAILLDTSNSMDGLISQAKSQLWKIVNEFAKAKRKGERPRLEVALFEYGNDSLPASEGYIRQVSGFTTDLDKLSEDLFGLKTNGGSEYCGQVIDTATRTLSWSKSTDALKLIFIAGNEPFTQGKVNYRDAAKNAIENGIAINTIFCGAENQGVSGMWKDGAMLADGSFAFIDSNKTVAHITSPHDKEIARLGGELNKTYIAYGSEGKVKARRQSRQDTNAASVAQGASVQRAVSKSKKVYNNQSWDLVDAMESEGGMDLDNMAPAALPSEMKGMDSAEKKAYVAKKAKERKDIQKKISKLNKKREAYVTSKRKEMSTGSDNTFDSAVIGAIHSAGKKKGFEFE